MFLAIIAFILILGLLIFVHELGHFVLAKRAGIKVEEFGFGYPPRIFKIKKGETIYSLNLFPIGGFVRIYGESSPEQRKKKIESSPEQKRAFYSQPLGTRAKILVAGVIMNLFLAAFLLMIGYRIGLPTIVEDAQTGNLSGVKIQITQVAFGSPAEEAGIKIGDAIREFRISNLEFPINSVEQVQNFVEVHKGEKIILIVQRGSQILEKELVPRVHHPEDEGPLGVGLAKTAIVSYPWYQALVKGFLSTISLTWFIIVAFGGIIWQLATTGELIGQLSGPVGIFSLTSQAAQLGFIYILQFTAILSINLAILNALPFPALDGGRLLFLAIEKIKGSPVSQKVERISHAIGFTILILLMIVVTWRDIVRIF
jgi:regulator of sigma E protease